MPQPHRNRATVRVASRRAEDESGFDVWVPALVALAAAIFMVFHAEAADLPTAEPRPIYDATLFDGTPPASLVPAEVEVAALPPLAIAPATRAASAAAASAAPAADAEAAVFSLPEPEARPAMLTVNADIVRVVIAGVIGALLLGALLALSRVWRRMEPVAV